MSHKQTTDKRRRRRRNEAWQVRDDRRWESELEAFDRALPALATAAANAVDAFTHMRVPMEAIALLGYMHRRGAS